MWLKKREFASYLLLWKVFKDQPFNIGEALDVLEDFMSRKVAYNVLKRLEKLGWISRVNSLEFKVLSFNEIFNSIVLPYLGLRLERNFRSKGYKIKVRVENDRLKIEGETPPLKGLSKYYIIHYHQ